MRYKFPNETGEWKYVGEPGQYVSLKTERMPGSANLHRITVYGSPTKDPDDSQDNGIPRIPLASVIGQDEPQIDLMDHISRRPAAWSVRRGAYNNLIPVENKYRNLSFFPGAARVNLRGSAQTENSYGEYFCSYDPYQSAEYSVKHAACENGEMGFRLQVSRDSPQRNDDRFREDYFVFPKTGTPRHYREFSEIPTVNLGHPIKSEIWDPTVRLNDNRDNWTQVNMEVMVESQAGNTQPMRCRTSALRGVVNCMSCRQGTAIIIRALGGTTRFLRAFDGRLSKLIEAGCDKVAPEPADTYEQRLRDCMGRQVTGAALSAAVQTAEETFRVQYICNFVALADACQPPAEPANRTAAATQANILSASATKETADAAVYPNPTSGTFTVELPADAGVTSLQVVNHLGQVVHTLRPTAHGQRHFTIDAGACPPGLYMVQIQTRQGTISRKIVRE